MENTNPADNAACTDTPIPDTEEGLAIKRLVEGLAELRVKLDEQRSFPRYPFNLQVSICKYGAARKLKRVAEAWAQTLSCSGIDFLTTKMMLPNDKVLYVNFNTVLGRRRCIKVQIVYSKKLIPGIYRTGGRFAFSVEDKYSPLESDP